MKKFERWRRLGGMKRVVFRSSGLDITKLWQKFMEIRSGNIFRYHFFSIFILHLAFAQEYRYASVKMNWTFLWKFPLVVFVIIFFSFGIWNFLLHFYLILIPPTFCYIIWSLNKRFKIKSMKSSLCSHYSITIQLLVRIKTFLIKI